MQNETNDIQDDGLVPLASQKSLEPPPTPTAPRKKFRLYTGPSSSVDIPLPTGKEIRKLAPVIGATALTAVAPEAGVPALIGLAGLGAGGGEAAGQLIEHATGSLEAPPTSWEAAKRIGKEGAYQAAAQGVGSTVLYPLGKAADWVTDKLGQRAVDNFLGRYGITKTLGEKLESPGIQATEGVTGKTAVGAGPAQKFFSARYQGIRKMMDDLVSNISDKYANATGLNKYMLERVPQQIEAERAGHTQFLDKLADEVMGQEKIGNKQAGEVIAKAAKGELNLTKATARMYHSVVGEAMEKTGAVSPLKATAPVLQEVAEVEGSAYKLFTSALSSGELGSFRRGSGEVVTEDAVTNLLKGDKYLSMELKRMTPGEQDQFLSILRGESPSGSISRPAATALAYLQEIPVDKKLEIMGGSEAPPTEVSWKVLKATRTGVGKMLDVLKKRGDTNNVGYASLSRMYGSLSDDMEQSIKQYGNDTILKMWRAGNEVSTFQHDIYDRQNFISDMINKMPSKPLEDVVSQLMRQGEESNFDAVISALEGYKPSGVPRDIPARNREAASKLGRSVLNYARNQQRKVGGSIQGVAEEQLGIRNFLSAISEDNRPGIKKLLGDANYAKLTSDLKDYVKGPLAQSEGYTKFLKTIAGDAQFHEKELAKKVLPTHLDPAALEDAKQTVGYVDQMLGNKPEVRNQFGRNLVEELISRSTAKGQLEAAHNTFNPVSLADAVESHKETLKQFLPKSSMDNLEQTSKALSGLALSKEFYSGSGNITGKFHALSGVTRVGAEVGTAITAAAAAYETGKGGHPLRGAIIGATTMISPRVAFKILTNPVYSNALVAAAKAEPGTAKFGQLVGRLAVAFRESDEEEKKDNDTKIREFESKAKFKLGEHVKYNGKEFVITGYDADGKYQLLPSIESPP